EPVVEVLAKTPGGHFGFQTAIGSGNDTHVDPSGALLADALVLSLLQNAEQFALQVERDFAHFVEKKRAAIRGFETARAVFHGAGERAFGMAEELAFIKLLRNRGAVDADQRPLAALAALVDFAGHEFLARAGLAENQHAGVGGRDEFNLPRNGVQSGALPDEAAERA